MFGKLLMQGADAFVKLAYIVNMFYAHRGQGTFQYFNSLF